MASPLAPTFGVWLVTIWIQALLQGCGMLQVWLYFHWYKNDSWKIKAMASATSNVLHLSMLIRIQVVALLVTETFQCIVNFQVTYVYLIDGFGNLPGLFLIHWQDSAQLFAMYLSAFIVQMYFGYCIYTLDRKNKILAGIIFSLALTQIGAGLAQTISTVGLASFTQLGSTKAITTVEAAAAFLCDIVITVSLVRSLGNRKTGARPTNTLLDTLMINAINRGVLTAACALCNLILFLALPGTFYFFIGLTASGKLYMNSALATLNTRKYVYSKAHGAGSAWGGFEMGNMQAHSAESGETNGSVRVIVTKESETVTESTSDDKKSTFIDGML
ncbi:hypothetical protein D9619_008563 [Psilocybe cf. subviscida]|uniref:DUF6534 domain-containing protein n=1 Tax=Psilocybe cf. subviscida TaxID=2480587 RepID=A0A8H5F0R3_9AGAR|nr:hypothetical protein D9619_008563 [Psilocybe cf. subviscida]